MLPAAVTDRLLLPVAAPARVCSPAWVKGNTLVPVVPASVVLVICTRGETHWITIWPLPAATPGPPVPTPVPMPVVYWSLAVKAAAPPTVLKLPLVPAVVLAADRLACAIYEDPPPPGP